jgi:putative 3-methyladenine DNA glycosylase
MHYCVNIVCGRPGVSRAVLLRAGEVVEGLDLARGRRPAARKDRDLARGPARLAAALGLGREDDGSRLGGPGDRLHLAVCSSGDVPGPDRVRCGPRVGVAGPGGDGRAFPWRFWIADDPTVSAYRPAKKRGPRGGGSRR